MLLAESRSFNINIARRSCFRDEQQDILAIELVHVRGTLCTVIVHHTPFKELAGGSAFACNPWTRPSTLATQICSSEYHVLPLETNIRSPGLSWTPRVFGMENRIFHLPGWVRVHVRPDIAGPMRHRNSVHSKANGICTELSNVIVANLLSREHGMAPKNHPLIIKAADDCA